MTWLLHPNPTGTRYLTAAQAEPVAYSDASFSAELTLGAWAFYVPEWSIKRIHVCKGPSVEWFEYAGVIAAAEYICRLDVSDRAIRVHTDSQVVIELMTAMARNIPRKPRNGGDHLANWLKALG